MGTPSSGKRRDELLSVAANAAAGAEPSAESPSTEQPTAEKRLIEKDIVGLKYFDLLLPLFQRLHDEGCQRDKAGNRDLHYDQYFLMVLVFLFNPICSSLRALQQASELQNVQKKLGCQRAALGSLSEAATIFDPERLVEIIQELSGQLPPSPHGAGSRDERLNGLAGTLTLVDATLITAMPRIREASVRKRRGESGTVKWRLHAHFEVDRHVPSRIDVTPNGGGDYDERAVLHRTIESPALREGPGLRQVQAVQRHRRGRVELRLPTARQQRLRGRRRPTAHRGGPRGERAVRPDRAVRKVRQQGHRSTEPHAATGPREDQAARLEGEVQRRLIRRR